LTDTVAALEKQCAQFVALVSELADDEWARPTRCPPMSVKELVVHVAQAAAMTAALAASDMSGHEPTVDRARWWVSPSRRPPAEILADAQSSAAPLDPAAASQMLSEKVEILLDQLKRVAPDAVVGNEWRTIRADELAGSRVLEIGVHTMDLGHATLRGERIEADSAAIVTGILDTLLGDPLPTGLGWDARTYILTGTGRRDLSSNERSTLGRLADKFPLMR
jgi:uncharacterized protein (TIGR03083 family)